MSAAGTWEQGQSAAEREDAAVLQRAGFFGSNSMNGASSNVMPPPSWFEGQSAHERESTALLQRGGYIPSESGKMPPPEWVHSLSAQERDDNALLQRAGFIAAASPGGPPLAWEEELSAQERADTSVLRAAGILPTPVAAETSTPADDTALLQAAGFMPEQSAANASTVAHPVAAFTPPLPLSQPAPAVGVSAAPPAKTVQLSHQQFATLDIAPGGETALGALESKMGMAFAGDCRGKQYWSAAPSAAGGTLRAFSGLPSQFAAIQAMVGELGSPKLRLSLGKFDTRSFKLAGPGAAEARLKQPPQLPQTLPDKLRSALGR